RWTLLAGLAAGCAAALKQVAAVFVPVFVLAIWLGRAQEGLRTKPYLGRSIGVLVVGFTVAWIACVGFAAFQGVVPEFWHAVFVYGPTLANSASAHMRQTFLQAEQSGFGRVLAEHPALLPVWFFLTGNPQDTAWWGAGIWPLLLMSGCGAAFL